MALAKRLLTNAILVCISWAASVSSGQAQDTLTFTSSPNSVTVTDGAGGSNNLSWIDLTLSSDLNENWTLETPYGSPGLVQSWNNSNFQSSITLESSSTSANFWLKGLYVFEWGAAQSATVTVTGYDNGSSTGSYTFSP